MSEGNQNKELRTWFGKPNTVLREF